MPAYALTCPQCSAKLQPPPERTQFFCQFCGATVVVPPEPAPESLDSAGSESEEPPLSVPVDLSKFTIERQGGDLHVRYPWSRLAGLTLLPFLIIGSIVTVVFFSFGGAAQAMGPGPGGFGLMGFFPLTLVAVVAYIALAHLVNTTTVHVTGGQLAISHGPLPWKSPPPASVENLKQLFVKRELHTTKNGSRETFELHALQHKGPPLVLLKGEQDLNTVRSLERLVEVHLGVADRAVKGEA